MQVVQLILFHLLFKVKPSTNFEANHFKLSYIIVNVRRLLLTRTTLFLVLV